LAGAHEWLQCHLIWRMTNSMTSSSSGTDTSAWNPDQEDDQGNKNKSSNSSSTDDNTSWMEEEEVEIKDDFPEVGNAEFPKEEMIVDDEENEDDGLRTHSRVTKASYPIREPLVRILQGAVRCAGGSTETTLHYEYLRDSFTDAITNIISNSFQALDAMYFQTASNRRNQPWFHHRLCLRIHIDPDAQELSITDYGCGMTRAHLINILSVPNISSRSLKALHSLKKHQEQKIQTQQPLSTSTKQNLEKDDDNIFTDDEHEITSTSQPRKKQLKQKGRLKESPNLPFTQSRNSPLTGKIAIGCTAKDIGGFYASLCALGTRVNVGTKVSLQLVSISFIL
jgi:hypothetical protein